MRRAWLLLALLPLALGDCARGGDENVITFWHAMGRWEPQLLEIVDAYNRFTEEAEQSDDVTFVVIKRSGAEDRASTSSTSRSSRACSTSASRRGCDRCGSAGTTAAGTRA